MENKQKAVEEFINSLSMVKPPSETPTVMDGLKYAMQLMALADKLYDAGYRAGLTEKTINDLKP